MNRWHLTALLTALALTSPACVPEDDAPTEDGDAQDMAAPAEDMTSAQDMTAPTEDMGGAEDMATAEQDMAPAEDMGGAGEDMPSAQDMSMTIEDMGGGEEDMGGAPVDTSPIGGARPAQVFVPDGYDNSRALPLLILLHGYSANGAGQDFYLQVSAQVDDRDFILVLPEGTTDFQGNQFWNAADACCDFANTGVDDVGYLTGLIDEATQRFNVDEGRVYFMGHSNGGFMSYRMACELADRVTGIASLAGTTFAEASSCAPSQPVAILHAHGTSDDVILYGGGVILGASYPGAEDTAQRWVGYNGCEATPQEEAGALKLLRSAAAPETDVLTWPGCPTNGDVTLWRINGGPHIPGFNPDFTPGALDYLFQFDRTP